MNYAKTIFVAVFVIALLILSLYVVSAASGKISNNINICPKCNPTKGLGTIVISSNVGANAYLCSPPSSFGGYYNLGYSSLSRGKVPAGTYVLYLVASGYKTYWHAVIISTDRITIVNAYLKPGKNTFDGCPGVI